MYPETVDIIHRMEMLLKPIISESLSFIYVNHIHFATLICHAFFHLRYSERLIICFLLVGCWTL